jgi:hypothetical protein
MQSTIKKLCLRGQRVKMSTEPSIQDLMRDITRRMDSYNSTAMDENTKDSSLSLELETFMSVDPILADLYKQYVDAKQRYLDLVKTNGEDDPMAEVGLDVMESAECAVETRLIELRDDRKICIEAMYQRKLILKAKRLEDHKRSFDYKERLKEFYQRGSTKFQVEQEAKDDFFLMMLLWLWLAGLTRKAVRSLSLADAFRHVSLNKIAAIGS